MNTPQNLAVRIQNTTFTEEQIIARMIELDVKHMGRRPEDINVIDAVNHLEGSNDEFMDMIAQAQEELYAERTDDLRQEAIERLTDEWKEDTLTESQKLMEKLANVQESISYHQERLTELEKEALNLQADWSTAACREV